MLLSSVTQGPRPGPPTAWFRYERWCGKISAASSTSHAIASPSAARRARPGAPSRARAAKSSRNGRAGSTRRIPGFVTSKHEAPSTSAGGTSRKASPREIRPARAAAAAARPSAIQVGSGTLIASETSAWYQKGRSEKRPSSVNA